MYVNLKLWLIDMNVAVMLHNVVLDNNHCFGQLYYPFSYLPLALLSRVSTTSF